MAIDRETIADSVIGRGEKPAYGWVPPGVSNYQPVAFPFATLSTTDRHAAAQRLYREAGFDDDNPLQVEIRFNTSETHKQIALAVQKMWHDV